MHIAVAGAGMGGLSAAIGLSRRGFEVSVFEQAPALTAVGAGLIVAPNAARLVAGELGIPGVPGAVKPPGLHLRRWQDGSTISYQAFGAATRERYGSDYLAVHRADLLDAMHARLENTTVQLGRRLTGLDQSDSGVLLHFEDGATVSADVLVAADGVRSAAAAALGLPTVPRASGYAAYRGMAPRELVDELGVAHTGWLGPDHHFVHYPVRGGQELNFVAVVPTDREESESWSAPGDVRDVRAEYADWDPRVRRVLESTDTVTLWGLYDRPVRDVMHAGRVALLGDAAHPMLPFFAQGASMAIEDAAVLSALLETADADNVEEALATYSTLRVPRVRMVQSIAYRNASMFHLPDGPEQQERDSRLRNPEGGDPLRANDWLFGHDVRDEVAALAEPSST